MEPIEYLGLTSIAVGLVLYGIAPRLPMNTLVGLRLGYTFMSRRIWVKFNRELGMALVVIGIMTFALNLVFTSVEALFTAYTGMVIAAYVILLVRARREGELEASLRPPEPGPTYEPFKQAYINPVMYLPAVAIMIAPLLVAFTYNSVSLVTLLYMMPGVLAVALLIIARADPVILYNPWVPPDKMLRVVYEALILAGLIETIGLASSLHAERYGTLLISSGLLAALTLTLSAYIVLRFVYIMWRK